MSRSLIPIVSLALVLAASPVQAGDAKLYLSWHAPHGAPRAAEALRMMPGDTARTDTLYLCFDPGESDSTFYGLMATLYFRAQGSDTLGPYWKAIRGRGHFPDLQITYGPDPTFERPTPWSSSGMGVYHWDFNRTSGRLRLVHAMPAVLPVPVEKGTIYTFARIVLRRPAGATTLWGQPLCVEWWLAELTFELDRQVPQVNRGGSRFVTINMPRGQGCAELEASGPAPKVWKPGSN